MIVSRSQWHAERDAHRSILQPRVDSQIERARRGIKHPIEDFLFTYYSYRAGHLLRWSPGVDVVLEADHAEELDWCQWYDSVPDGYVLSVNRFRERRCDYLERACDYLHTTMERPPQFGCFGLHEWAMVYRAKAVRHEHVPLRLPQAEIDTIVEQGKLQCTHYDAFRFFTNEAVSRNRLALQRIDMIDHDQPGCIHANMDLYKFAYKIVPFVPATILRDTFLLAAEARVIDMRASPYDLRAYGHEPILIETKSGREEYIVAQQTIMNQAQPLRRALANIVWIAQTLNTTSRTRKRWSF